MISDTPEFVANLTSSNHLLTQKKGKCWVEVKIILIGAGYSHLEDFRLGKPWVRGCAPWKEFSPKWQFCKVDRMRPDGTFPHKHQSRIKQMKLGGEMTGNTRRGCGD